MNMNKGPGHAYWYLTFGPDCPLGVPMGHLLGLVLQDTKARPLLFLED